MKRRILSLGLLALPCMAQAIDPHTIAARSVLKKTASPAIYKHLDQIIQDITKLTSMGKKISQHESLTALVVHWYKNTDILNLINFNIQFATHTSSASLSSSVTKADGTAVCKDGPQDTVTIDSYIYIPESSAAQILTWLKGNGNYQDENTTCVVQPVKETGPEGDFYFMQLRTTLDVNRYNNMF